MGSTLTELLSRKNIVVLREGQWQFHSDNTIRGDLWNYTIHLKHCRNLNEARIIFMPIEDAFCGARAEKRKLRVEDYLLLRHSHAFEHCKNCQNVSSFHYQLYHKKGVRSPIDVWKCIKDGWRLDKYSRLVRNLGEDDESSSEDED